VRSALFLLIKGKFMENFSKITQSFKNQSFMKTIGAQLDLVDDGKVIISVKLEQNMMQQHGFGHAGVTF
jgi:acyl-coenzyme A thioesterase PaaI-like protein